MANHTTIYKKEYFKRALLKEFDKNMVNYDSNPNKGNYIDNDFSTVFDCIVKAFEETTESKIE